VVIGPLLSNVVIVVYLRKGTFMTTDEINSLVINENSLC
jgi:hypothetical protein